ncbi:uncharacterized protein K452DRAFT_61114 [Aplosporella prunicola CBS 121167]|uniref:Rhodopsin domain-containing protein n=1 Tax=Aplosporella prunicola CBS 121167 TaxID=1176127 RepID=A0A6A6BAF1_9PEZI|nr:uncharacterized protein K452DRAFT_61114 [Aplosporella prunicola CBS 121167]KAF2139481.1 hypothetical protein K452DRAFT_61114 [Aplosporella prunicola CBS 121167]
MATDPVITKIFGPAPDGLNLKESRQTEDNVISIVLIIVAAVSVTLRIIARKMQGLFLRADDYAMVVGLFLVAAMVAMSIVAAGYGAGRHIWSVDVGNFMNVMKIVYCLPFIYAASQTVIKFGILYFYYCIFGQAKPDSSFRIMFFTATFLTTVYPLILWITMAVACRPVHYYWDQYIGGTGTCIDTNAFYLALGVVNMINDMIILAVPLPPILRLKMDTKKKLAVVGIMMMGGFVCVASIIRIYYLAKLNEAIDATFAIGPAFVWTTVEPAVGIVSACLPTFRPLFRKAKALGSTIPRISMPTYPSSSQRTASEPKTWHRQTEIELGEGRGYDDDEARLTSNVSGGGHTQMSAQSDVEAGGCVGGGAPHAAGRGIVVQKEFRVREERDSDSF